MKINVDGPKGSGKSTLANILTELCDARHERVSYRHVYSTDEYVRLVNNEPERDLVMERGALSSWIYTWVRHGTFQCDEWRKPMTQHDFQTIIQQYDLYIVLYATDNDELSRRLGHRDSHDTSSRQVTEQERDELNVTNHLFTFWAHHFRDQLNMDNVLPIDIDKWSSQPRELAQHIMEYAKERGVTPVPRNDLP